MFGIGTTELLIILAIVVLLFGTSRIPELGKGLGQGIRGFKEALKGEQPTKDVAKRDNDPSNPPKA